MTSIYKHVPADSYFMRLASDHAYAYSTDKHKTGAVIGFERTDDMSEYLVLGMGANDSAYHKHHGCRRVELGCESGEGYDLCLGCSPNKHAEQRAIVNVVKGWGDDAARKLLRGASLYFWGHYRCCISCLGVLDTWGVETVYLVDRAEALFDSKSPNYMFR